MTPRQLYNLFNIKPPKPKPVVHREYILSFKYKELFGIAEEAFRDSQEQYSIAYSDLSITRYLSDDTIVTTYFRDSRASESMRGVTGRTLFIDNCHDDETVNKLKVLHSSNFKNIVIFDKNYLDNPTEE